MKHNVLKRTLAGVMAVLCVAAYMPANVGTGGLFGGTELVAKADTAIPANGTNGYIVGNVISCSAEADRMEIHDNSAAALFDNSDSKFCCCFSGEMTINFSYASSFVPKKYYIRTANDTEDYYWRNMSQWRLQAKNANGNWVDLDVKDNSDGDLLPEANNEAVGFELNTTTAYKDYRLTGIKTFGFGEEAEHDYRDEYDDLVCYDCIFQLSEIYFEEGVDSRTNLSDATVTLANKKAIVSVNGNIVPETEYDLKFGTTVANASDTYPTSAGKYYAFAIAKNGSKDYRGIATRSFAVISNSTSTRYYPYDINKTHGDGQRPLLFFEGDYIEGNSGDYLTIYLDGEQVLKDKKQRYTIPKVCECVSDGYDESTYGHHEYIFYLESVPVPICDASVTMQTGSPYITSVVLNGKTLTLNKDYTITYKDANGQISNIPPCVGNCTAIITGKNSYVDSVEVEIPAIGHDWDAPVYTWNADNTKVTATRTCKHDASHVETETVDTVYSITQNATCEEAGTGLYTATFTNPEFAEQTKEVTIDAKGHTPAEAVIENEVAPTYEADGSYDEVVYCSVCGEEISRETIVIPKLKVTYTPVDAVSATCTTVGNSAYYTGSDGKYYVLDGGVYKEIEENSWVIPATGHKLTKTNAKAATINAEGNIAYWTCSECGKIFSDENGTTEITREDTVIPKLTSYAVTSNINGKTTTKRVQEKKSTTVTAPAVEGKTFSHWEVNGKKVSTSAKYSFIVLKDTEITAVYVDTAEEIKAEPVLNISTSKTTSNGKNAINFLFTRSIPEGYTVQEAGVLYATNKLAGATASVSGYATLDLTNSANATTLGVENVESVVKNNSTGNIKKCAYSNVKADGTISLTYAIGANTTAYVYAVGYVKATNAEGETVTLYTDFVATNYTNS